MRPPHPTHRSYGEACGAKQVPGCGGHGPPHSTTGTHVPSTPTAQRPIDPNRQPQVNEDYLEYLLALDKKLKFVHEDEIARTSAAKRDLEPALEKLRIKALSKVGGGNFY